MEKNKWPALLGALACALATPASAALYRCGNAFQDRPCDVQSQQQVLRPANAGAGMAPSGPLAAQTPASAASAAAAPPIVGALPASPREDGAAVEPPAASSSAGPAPARKGPPSLACGNLREQRNAIEGRLRVGGRTETVQMYQRQLRGVETNLAEGNC